MTKSIWQYSLRALLAFVTLTAAVVAIFANYPLVALIVLFLTGSVLFGSGMIIDVIRIVSSRTVYTKHPYLAAGTSLLTSVFSFTVFGFFCLLWWHNNDERWLALTPAVIFAALGVFCLRPLWRLLTRSI